MGRILRRRKEALEGSIYVSTFSHSFRRVSLQRYNAVFHLVTAAEGAERFYTLENNDARTETPAEARRLDHLSRAAWLGHPKHFVIDNRTDFEGKMERLISIASNLVGLPTTSKSVTIKYLLKGEPDLARFPEDVRYSVFEVEKVR